MEFGGFLGNRAIKERLSGAFRQGRVSHSYLLCGQPGSGRHTLARQMAAAMQCTGGGEVPCGQCKACRKVFGGVHPDVSFVDDPEHKQISVDVIRPMCADVSIRPNEGNRKIYIIHQEMTVEAQNALLKTLEEPPAYAVFLLLMEAEEQVLPTIRSRCQCLSLAPLTDAELTGALRKAVPTASETALAAACASAEGNLGRALADLRGDLVPPEAALLAERFAAQDRFGLLEVLIPLEKQKREPVTAILTGLTAQLTHALTVPSSPLRAPLLQGRTPAEVFAAIEAVRRATGDLNAYVGVGSVIGWLVTRLK